MLFLRSDDKKIFPYDSPAINRLFLLFLSRWNNENNHSGVYVLINCARLCPFLSSFEHLRLMLIVLCRAIIKRDCCSGWKNKFPAKLNSSDHMPKSAPGDRSEWFVAFVRPLTLVCESCCYFRFTLLSISSGVVRLQCFA